MYKIIITPAAQKELRKISNQYYTAIIRQISSLAENPHPHGSIKLEGTANAYRIRVEMYRILYTVEDKILTVEVIRIAHRSKAYRR